MEKDIFLKDYLVSRLISFGKEVDGYSRIYYQTNEDLFDTYLDTEFEGKEVLSVLASSDQVLTARYLGASKVDAFDRNRLALYYFYLRIWSIEYKDELYPLILNGNRTWLKELLKLVKPRNEKEQKALEFFKRHINEHTRLENLFYDIDAQPKGDTIFRKPRELEDCTSPDLDFFDIDLFRDFYTETSYDILLI